MSGYSNVYLKQLFSVIASLKDENECAAFFEDLCTVRELIDMAQRYETAVLLDQGKSYQTIAESIGISTATISRVNRCLVYGAGGYKMVLDRAKESSNED